MLKYLLLLLFVPMLVFADWTDNHPIYRAIIKLNPSMDKKLALRLSNAIHNNVKLHGLDPYRAVAIAMQESSLRRVHRRNKSGDITDIGMFQVHVNSVAIYNLDIQRLVNHDLDYTTKAYTTIMKEKLQICKHLGDEAWSCYHSGTRKYRKKYVKAVNRWYRRIVNE